MGHTHWETEYMEELLIEGGVPLQGTMRVSGSKNAALPIFFASLLVEGTVVYHNVPHLRDIDTTIAMLDLLGCTAGFTAEGSTSVEVTPEKLNYEAPYELVRTMRASILALGPLLAKLGKAKVALPGGCTIGARPIEQHLKGLERMGATFDLRDGYVLGTCDTLRGAKINLDFPSVGATENLLMAASLAQGTTIIHNAACEPEIVDLANFLNACGAKITGHGSDTITIEGVSGLHGTEYAIMPDRIEAGTLVIAAAITHGNCVIEECPVPELYAVLSKLTEMGVGIQATDTSVTVSSSGIVSGVDVITRPYPGFPTDMQAQLMALMCLAEGSSTVEETIFENRFMHVPELNRMGADIKLAGSRAIIRGVSELRGAPVMSSDLRASASLVLAGLAAKGVTRVQRIYHLDRGYDKIEAKLHGVGARIRRVEK